jgi:hypothetical protein
MLRSRYFAPSLLILALVGILHWVASFEGFYWTIGWYDIMMHFLGGAWVALMCLWAPAWPLLGWTRSFQSKKNIVIAALVVGILWEILELWLAFTDMGLRGYWSDTSQDLLMDFLGAVTIVSLYFPKSKTE